MVGVQGTYEWRWGSLFSVYIRGYMARLNRYVRIVLLVPEYLQLMVARGMWKVHDARMVLERILFLEPYKEKDLRQHAEGTE